MCGLDFPRLFSICIVFVPFTLPGLDLDGSAMAPPEPEECGLSQSGSGGDNNELQDVAAAPILYPEVPKPVAKVLAGCWLFAKASNPAAYKTISFRF